MQAENLRPEDVRELQKVFKEKIEPTNPEAVMRIFDSQEQSPFSKSLPKDCLFKNRCKPYQKR